MVHFRSAREGEGWKELNSRLSGKCVWFEVDLFRGIEFCSVLFRFVVKKSGRLGVCVRSARVLRLATSIAMG